MKIINNKYDLGQSFIERVTIDAGAVESEDCIDTIEMYSIKAIYRPGTPFKVVLRDEQTKGEVEFTPAFSASGYYTEFKIKHTFIDNRKYLYTIKDVDGNILFKDLLHVMETQEVEEYTLNKDQYVAPEEEPASTPIYKII